MSLTRFDTIADVYDETRRKLDEETLVGMDEMVTKHGCHSILEIGVGTGRVALPLMKKGYTVTGMDISIRMMERARVKGFRNLILADGRNVPFREKSFDAALMAHVFHLLDDPVAVMKEAAKVCRVGVFALVRKDGRWPGSFWREDASKENNYDEETKKLIEERRTRVRKIFEKYGFDPSKMSPNWRREEGVIEAYPPDDLKIVSDVLVTETVEERLARFSKGGYSFFSQMPNEMRKEMLKELRTFWQSAPAERFNQPRREIYQLAMWNSERLLSK